MTEGQVTVEMLLIKIGQLSVQLDLANSQVAELKEMIRQAEENRSEKKEEKS
jgi:hypothetical protein